MSNTIMLKGRVRMGSWSFPAFAEATNAPCLHPLFILARASVQFYAPMSVGSCAPVSAFAGLQDRQAGFRRDVDDGVASLVQILDPQIAEVGIVALQ
jgi:hypothetical protein